MVKKARLLFTGFVLMLFIGSIPALAKGPFDKVVIQAPTLDEPIEVTNAEQLEALGMTQLMDIFSDVDVNTADLGTGYELTRYGYRGSEYVPFDQVIFYPGEEEHSAYVFYVGIVNGGSEFDGRWFDANEAGNTMMRHILAEHGITIVQATSSPLHGLLNWFETALGSLPR